MPPQKSKPIPLDDWVCHTVDSIEEMDGVWGLKCTCGKYVEIDGITLAKLMQRCAKKMGH
jgi:hypothetical protein